MPPFSVILIKLCNNLDMSFQSNDFKNLTSNQKKILDLEKQYFKILSDFFKDPFFTKGLKDIESYIKKNMKSLNAWNVENKVALACERLVNLHVHKNFPDKKSEKMHPLSCIKDIYPSPLSSDTAFITEDAIINIDCKTYSIGIPGVKSGKGKGNKDDWKRATIGVNQTSFNQPKHKTGRNGSGPAINIKFNLAKNDCFDGITKPTISLILGFLYYDDGKIFEWYTDKTDQNFAHNAKLACIPNGSLSELFNYKIISNVKSYQYKDGEKNRVSKNAIGINSFRADHQQLIKRYDSEGKEWSGFSSWII